jgi:hypothetical protein
MECFESALKDFRGLGVSRLEEAGEDFENENKPKNKGTLRKKCDIEGKKQNRKKKSRE